MMIEITTAGCHVGISNGLLEVQSRGGAPYRLPPAEVTRLVVETPHTTVTAAALLALAEAGVAVLFCDGRHRPGAEVFSALGSGSGLRAELLRAQVLLRADTRRRLWKQVVRAKLLRQAETLDLLADGRGAARLRHLAREVAPGDPANREAAGAQVYWSTLLGPGFQRCAHTGETGGAGNALLDYGYAILRAVTLRALHAAGLHPAFGIHHASADNPGNLADDLLEPYRPAVDRLVVTLLRDAERPMGLSPTLKLRLAELPGYPVGLAGQEMRLANAMLETCRGHALILRREARRAVLPDRLGGPDQCPMPGAPCG